MISTVYTGKVTAFRPTREEIAAIEVGSEAPDAFGKLARVVEITARKEDIHGKLFICYYTTWSENARMSNSMKEGEIVRTVDLSRAHTSAEIDAVERAAAKKDDETRRLEASHVGR